VVVVVGMLYILEFTPLNANQNML